MMTLDLMRRVNPEQYDSWRLEFDACLEPVRRRVPPHGDEPADHRELSPGGLALINQALTVTDYLTRPPRQMLVDDLLACRSTAFMYGEAGAGKSFAALDLALHVAAGLPWHGRGVRQGPVTYFAGEGADGLGQRIESWMAHHGLTRTDLRDFRLLPVAVDLLEEKEETMRDFGSYFKPALAVVDTFARSLTSGDENSVADVTSAIAKAELLRADSDCTVLFVHHMNKSGDYRGSTGIHATVDSMFEVKKRAKAAAGVTLSCRKQKDQRPFEPLNFDLVELGASCVLRMTTGTQLSIAAEQILELLASYAIATLFGRRSVQTRRSIQLATGFGKTTAVEALHDLREKELVQVIGIGSRKAEFLAITGDGLVAVRDRSFGV